MDGRWFCGMIIIPSLCSEGFPEIAVTLSHLTLPHMSTYVFPICVECIRVFGINVPIVRLSSYEKAKWVQTRAESKPV